MTRCCFLDSKSYVYQLSFKVSPEFIFNLRLKYAFFFYNQNIAISEKRGSTRYPFHTITDHMHSLLTCLMKVSTPSIPRVLLLSSSSVFFMSVLLLYSYYYHLFYVDSRLRSSQTTLLCMQDATLCSIFSFMRTPKVMIWSGHHLKAVMKNEERVCTRWSDSVFRACKRNG